MHRPALASMVLNGLMLWTALALLVYGLWTHDWRTIAAGAATLLIWPWVSGSIVGDDPYDEQHEEDW